MELLKGGDLAPYVKAANLLPVEKPPGDIGQAIVTGQNKSRMEMWWWIVAAAALPLLLIEWWVYTRRVHL